MAKINEVGVAAGYYGCGGLGAGGGGGGTGCSCGGTGCGGGGSGGGYLYVEFFGYALFKLYGDGLICNHPLAGLNCIGSALFEDLQTVLGFANKGTQRYGYRESNHTGAGNAHSHSILKDIGAKMRLYAMGLAAKYLCSFGNAERNRYGFCTTYCRNYLLLDECYY